MRVRFAPRLPKAGQYQVRLFYPPASNRATNALIVVRGKDGEKEVRGVADGIAGAHVDASSV